MLPQYMFSYQVDAKHGNALEVIVQTLEIMCSWLNHHIEHISRHHLISTWPPTEDKTSLTSKSKATGLKTLFCFVGENTNIIAEVIMYAN